MTIKHAFRFRIRRHALSSKIGEIVREAHHLLIQAWFALLQSIEYAHETQSIFDVFWAVEA